MTSVSCASSVSGQKLTPNSLPDNRSKSCDTSCTSNSSCFFKRRKPMNPLAYSMRPTHHKTNNNPVKQRVMSAKMLKLRQLQSQLNDANFHLAEVTRENQILKTLQKRQDKALSKYENTNADLPRLLHAHEEEIRVLTEKNKILRRSVKELTEQLKLREEELTRARDQLSHLERLDKDKHLSEREKLTDMMDDYKLRLRKSEEQVAVLNRKLMLEGKTSRQRLTAEIIKHKQCQKELLHAFDEIEKLTGLLEAKENVVRPRNSKFNKFQAGDSVSMSILKQHRNLSSEKLNPATPVTEVKLEPIPNGNGGKESESTAHRKNRDGFKPPMDSIRNRLSSGSSLVQKDHSTPSTNSPDIIIGSRDTSAGSFKSRPNSSVKLEKLPLVQENHRTNAKMKNEDNPWKSAASNRLNSNENDANESDDEYVEEKNVKVIYDIDRDNTTEASVEDRDETKSEKPDTDHQKNKENDTNNKSDGPDDLYDFINKIKNERQEKVSEIKNKFKLTRKDSDESRATIRSDSEDDLDKLASNLDEAIKKATENSKEEFDKKMGVYCTDVLNSVKSCSKVIDGHKESLKHSKQDTDTLLKTLQNTEKMESKLKKSFFELDDEMDFVKDILNEENTFRMQHKGSRKDEKLATKEKRSLANLDCKRKLLATLRAIDNGDSIESIEEPKQGPISKEMFGGLAH